MNTNMNMVHRWATGSSIIAGLTVLFTAHFPTLPAQLVQTTGPGSLAVQHHAVDRIARIMQTPFHGSALMTPTVNTSAVQTQFITGMLLILLGFVLHSWFLHRERRVPVHAAEHAKSTDWNNAEQMEIFWIEEKIRL